MPAAKRGSPRGFHVGAAMPWLVAAAMTGLALAAWALRPADRARPHGAALRVDVTDPDVPHRGVPGQPTVAVSPDGAYLAYVGGPRGSGRQDTGLYLRAAGQLRARRVEVPEPAFDVRSPFFSDDGRWLYFVNAGLYRVSTAGGPAQAVAPASGEVQGGACWRDGVIFSPAGRAGLVFVPGTGGPTQTLTAPDRGRGEVSHRWPSVLPDGRHLVFTVEKAGIESFDRAELALLDLDSRRWRALLPAGSYPRVQGSGRLLFARGGALMAVPLDLRTGEVRGPETRVLSGIATEPGSGAAQVDVARDTGTLVFVPGAPEVGRVEMVWVDPGGQVSPVGAPVASYVRAIPSPGGARIAATVRGPRDAVVVLTVGTAAPVRLALGESARVLAWARDGRLVVSAEREGTERAYLVDPSGSGPVEEVPAAMAREPAHDPPRRAGRAEPDDAGFDPGNVSPSPDGQWLVYDADTSGTREVYVRAAPPGSPARQVSSGGGRAPFWSPAGDALVFEVPDRRAERPPGARRLRQVGVTALGPELSMGATVDLFAIPDGVVLSGFDGRRFLGLRALPRPSSADRVEAIVGQW